MPSPNIGQWAGSIGCARQFIWPAKRREQKAEHPDLRLMGAQTLYKCYDAEKVVPSMTEAKNHGTDPTCELFNPTGKVNGGAIVIAHGNDGMADKCAGKVGDDD